MCGFLWTGQLKVACWRGCSNPAHHTKNPARLALCGVFALSPNAEALGEAAGSLRCHTLGSFNVLFDLVEVQVLVDGCAIAVHHTHGFVVLGHGREFAHL